MYLDTSQRNIHVVFSDKFPTITYENVNKGSLYGPRCQTFPELDALVADNWLVEVNNNKALCGTYPSHPVAAIKQLLGFGALRYFFSTTYQGYLIQSTAPTMSSLLEQK